MTAPERPRTPKTGASIGMTDMAQALGDLSVVCLSSLGPVLFAAMLLGDLGAQVIRVDRPGRARSHGMLAAGLWTDRRGENLLDGAAHFYRTYRTADGRFMAVGALEPQFYRELLDALGLAHDEWPQHDRSRWPEQSRRLASIFACRTRAEWEETFAGRDACVTPVLSLAEAAASAELRERGTFVDWGGAPQPAPAPRLSASAVIERPRSGWCSHTGQILAALGYAADEVAVLRAGEVVA